MFSGKRSQTLSLQGIKLYNLAYSNKKPTFKELFYRLFTTDYDRRMEEVLTKCRNSTISLLKKMEHEDISPFLNLGPKNAVLAILSADGKKLTKRAVTHNFRFFADVMKAAFEQNDHQTCMLYWYALSHTYITRLKLKEPRWFHDVYTKITEYYGTEKSHFKKHIEDFIHKGYGNDYLPSLFAIQQNREHTEALEETLQLFYAMLFLFKDDQIISLYKENVNMDDLFERTMYLKPLGK